MEIKRLKELRKALNAENWNAKTMIEVIAIIDEAIARQSVKSEEVQEAIGFQEEHVKDCQASINRITRGEVNFMESEVVDGAWTNKNINADIVEQEKREISLCNIAITALQAYEPWIPVSNGKPESGKHVLLCCEIKPLGKRYVCDGFYAQSKTITTICDGDNNCEYDEETDEYYLIEGYYEIIKNWDDYSSIVIDDFVTHWKPLPEPPKGE